MSDRTNLIKMTEKKNKEISVITSDDGYAVSAGDRTIFFSNSELINAGCKNCVWKLHDQCPLKLGEEESTKNGICQDMIHFLMSIADKNDSVSAVWEKFHIYKARLQEAEDYKDYMRLKEKIKNSENLSKEDMDQLQMDKTAAKIWWNRLNEHVIKSLAKVNDRGAKTVVDTKGGAGIFSGATINFTTKKELGDKS